MRRHGVTTLLVFLIVLNAWSQRQGRSTVTSTKKLTLALGNAALNPFDSAPVYSVGLTPVAVAVGDVNGDGKADLVVANKFSNSLSVLLGNGDGTFQSAISVSPGGSYPISVALGDFNGDGKLDIAVANSFNLGVSILLGNGDGTFQSAVLYSTGSNAPTSVTTGDFNGDGHEDVAVGEPDGLFVLEGKGDGTFNTRQVLNFPATGLITADLDGDGIPDIVTIQSPGQVTFYHWNGVVYSDSGLTLPIPAVAIAVADINHDGLPDVVGIGNGSIGTAINITTDPTNPQFNGGPTTSVNGNYLSSSLTALAVADLNGDGFPDVLVSDYNTNEFYVLLGDGTGNFGAQANFVTGSQPSVIAVGDFNNDGKVDAVIANGGEQDVAIALGKGDGTFHAARAFNAAFGHISDNPNDEIYNPNGIAVGDFNNDGKLDVIVSEGSTGQSAWHAGLFLGNGDGTFLAPSFPSVGGYSPFSIAVADFNGDKNLDFVVANQNQNFISVVFGNGDGTFGTPNTFSTGAGPAFVAAGDLNGDGYPDIVTANTSDNTVSVLLNSGNGTFSGTPYLVGANPMSVAIADLNGDGQPDLAVVNESDNSVSILLNNGNGTFGTATSYPVDKNPLSIAVADFNGDGIPDLVVADGFTNDVSVLLGSGGGKFQSAVNYFLPANSAPRAVWAADVTGDGIPDIIVADTTGNQVSVFVGNGDGTFQAAINYNSGVGPTAIAMGDFNGDGSSDLVTADNGNSDITILYGVLPTKTFSATALSSSANPSVYGQNVNWTATVTGNSPTGTIQFVIDGGNLGSPATLSGGSATSVSTSILSGGTHTVVANYSGDTQNRASSGTLSGGQVVNQANQTITFTTNAPASAEYGSSFGVAATASSGLTVAFTAAGSCSVVDNGNGTANYTITSASGTCLVSANQAGNSNYSGAPTVTETTNATPASTGVTVATSGSPSTYGQSLTFTATITSDTSAAMGRNRNPVKSNAVAGTVTWSANTGCGVSPISGYPGTATCSTSALPAGSDTITATYSGDTNHSGSTGSVSQVVNRASTTASVTSNVEPAAVNQSVTYTAVVSDAYSGYISGTITLKDGTKTLGTFTLSGGQASFTTAYTATGTHSITATYSGDANNLGITSPVYKQYIETLPVASTTKVTTSGSPSVVQSPVTFTATVTSMFGVIPDGEVVTFYDGTTQIGSGTTSREVARFTTSALQAATHSIKATYSGDATFKSSSGTVTQVVTAATTCPTETSTGKIPLNDLGTGTYQGFEGGLYPNGSNLRPDAHTQAGMAQAATIQPLDANGNPSPSGKIAIAAIGNSILSAGFGDFKNNRFPKSLHNPAVVPVNTTVGGTFLGSGTNSPTNPDSTYWTAIQTTMTNAGVTMAQVQAAVVYEFMCCYVLESKPFPADAQKQFSALITLMQTIKGKFPNLKLVYVMTREYGGYQVQCTAQEPYAYETGFAYQWLVADQIAGDPALNFDPTNGLVMSAWISWGPYMWADGVIPRSDGLTWLLSDYESDGFHLSALGAAQDGKAILKVFETDPTAISWFQ